MLSVTSPLIGVLLSELPSLLRCTSDNRWMLFSNMASLRAKGCRTVHSFAGLCWSVLQHNIFQNCPFMTFVGVETRPVERSFSVEVVILTVLASSFPHVPASVVFLLKDKLPWNQPQSADLTGNGSSHPISSSLISPQNSPQNYHNHVFHLLSRSLLLLLPPEIHLL